MHTSMGNVGVIGSVSRRRLMMIAGAVGAILTGCAAPEDHPVAPAQRPGADAAPEEAPERFTIVPDDYHVPYAGTTEEGSRFFLSEELFAFGSVGGESTGYVGLFLWQPDGAFDTVRVDAVVRSKGLPAGQAGHAGAEDLVAARLAELGDYVLEPITVEPFLTEVDGVTFGWKVGRYDSGAYVITIEPGDFIAYTSPWDGLGYDT